MLVNELNIFSFLINKTGVSLLTVLNELVIKFIDSQKLFEFLCFSIVISVFQTLFPSSKTLRAVFALFIIKIAFIITNLDQNCVQLFTFPKRIFFSFCIWRNNNFKQITILKSILRKTFKLKSYKKLQIAETEEVRLYSSTECH